MGVDLSRNPWVEFSNAFFEAFPWDFGPSSLRSFSHCVTRPKSVILRGHSLDLDQDWVQNRKLKSRRKTIGTSVGLRGGVRIAIPLCVRADQTVDWHAAATLS